MNIHGFEYSQANFAQGKENVQEFLEFNQKQSTSSCIFNFNHLNCNNQKFLT